MARDAEDRFFLIVVNPTSGKGRGRRVAEDLARRFTSAGCRAVVRETSGPGDAERISRDACVDAESRPTCVVACGGDGTMQEVANALAPLTRTIGDSTPTMGVAPVGRCNDFAHALGIPTDPSAVAEIILGSSPRPVDLGRANDRYFCTVATLGVDAAVSSFVDGMKMPLRGTIAYVYGALRVLMRYRPYQVRIQGDFGTIDQPVFLASSANTSTYGGSIRIVPNAVPTDGLIDLCIIDRVTRLRAFALLPMVLLGRHQSLKIVRFIRTKRLTIESDEPLELWADGERICTTPVCIEAVPGAVRVPLPADSPLEKGTFYFS